MLTFFFNEITERFCLIGVANFQIRFLKYVEGEARRADFGGVCVCTRMMGQQCVPWAASANVYM